jgi:hypothetical protein
MTDDAIYYRDGLQLPLVKRVMRAARQRMYDLFRAECRPDAFSSIVDIGASDEESDEANVLEKMHPHTGMITCARNPTSGNPHVAVTGARPPHGRGGVGDPANHAVELSVLTNAPDALARVLGQPKRPRFLADLILVPAQEARSVRERVAVVEGVSEVFKVHFGPGLARVCVHLSSLLTHAPPFKTHVGKKVPNETTRIECALTVVANCDTAKPGAAPISRRAS